MSRVLVIHGSESGNATQTAVNMINAWSSKTELKFTFDPKAMAGNAAAQKFDKLKDSYDILVIVTSSYGSGEPPENFRNFLYQLTATSAAGKQPFAGMQHAVLGLGDTEYENYMNCPRLVDKMMEECGSRRLHKRFESDFSKWSDAMAAGERQWMSDVFDVIQSGPDVDADPVCDWTGRVDRERQETPRSVADKIRPFELDELMDPTPEIGIGSWAGIGAAIAVALAAGAFFLSRRGRA